MEAAGSSQPQVRASAEDVLEVVLSPTQYMLALEKVPAQVNPVNTLACVASSVMLAGYQVEPKAAQAVTAEAREVMPVSTPM